MPLCREIGALYVDTVVEPWLGFYFDKNIGPEKRSNYALRETLLAAKHKSPGGTTAGWTCGSSPGMVSWFVKQALLDIARDTNTEFNEPKSREGWGQLAQKLGVKGLYTAARDTQRSKKPKPMKVFVNTWSVEGFVSEGMQPAELGWGTHEKWMPDNGRPHETGCGAAIYLLQPGANPRVRSWCPTPGAQYGFLVTHNESISIADYFTVRDGQRVVYRPTCHYAYHPANDAVLSLHEMFGAAGKMQPKWHILDENEIEDGIDELGVLLYGHARNAYWYGSQLSIEETRAIAPYQNATGMQVSSAVLAGMVWALENPTAGIVEADKMDFHRCLEIQRGDHLAHRQPRHVGERVREQAERRGAGPCLFQHDILKVEAHQFADPRRAIDMRDDFQNEIRRLHALQHGVMIDGTMLVAHGGRGAEHRTVMQR